MYMYIYTHIAAVSIVFIHKMGDEERLHEEGGP